MLDLPQLGNCCSKVLKKWICSSRSSIPGHPVPGVSAFLVYCCAASVKPGCTDMGPGEPASDSGVPWSKLWPTELLHQIMERHMKKTAHRWLLCSVAKTQWEPKNSSHWVAGSSAYFVHVQTSPSLWGQTQPSTSLPKAILTLCDTAPPPAWLGLDPLVFLFHCGIIFLFRYIQAMCID